MHGSLFFAIVLSFAIITVLVLRGVRVSRVVHDLRAAGRPVPRAGFAFWVLAVVAVGLLTTTWLVVLLS